MKQVEQKVKWNENTEIMILNLKIQLVLVCLIMPPSKMGGHIILIHDIPVCEMFRNLDFQLVIFSSMQPTKNQLCTRNF